MTCHIVVYLFYFSSLFAMKNLNRETPLELCSWNDGKVGRVFAYRKETGKTQLFLGFFLFSGEAESRRAGRENYENYIVAPTFFFNYLQVTAADPV